MPFMGDDFGDVHESVPAPEGEYTFVITEAKEQLSKKGHPQLVVTFSFVDHPEYTPVRWWYTIDPNKPEDQLRMARLEFKRFCVAFNQPTNFEVFELEGSRGTVFVAQEEGDDERIFNRMKFPRIKE